MTVFHLEKLRSTTPAFTLLVKLSLVRATRVVFGSSSLSYRGDALLMQSEITTSTCRRCRSTFCWRATSYGLGHRSSSYAYQSFFFFWLVKLHSEDLTGTTECDALKNRALPIFFLFTF